MLVVSVFFHFLLFTTFMFLPQTQDTVKRIKPAFTVSFVSIPTGSPDIQPAPQAKEAPVAPAPPKPKVEKPIPKPIPIPKPKVEKPIPKPIPIPMPKPVPEKSAASKALVSKLDELAKKTTPKKDKMAMAVPSPKKNILDNFENMKMKTAAEKKKPVRKKIAKDDLTIKELEFEQLSKKSAIHPSKDKPKKTSSLLKALDELEQMNQQQARAALSKPQAKPTKSETSELVKQLEALKKEKVQIKIDTSKLSFRHSQKFKSGIRNLKIAKIQNNSTAPAASGESGDPAANALSLYLGKAQIQINAQWKNPAGGGSGKVQVSFKIFPNGKIESPKVKKSSGVSKLDNLALLAVKNAVLPPFPKEIREPNLPFIFEFTYETKKN
jgi:TonB family protein